ANAAISAAYYLRIIATMFLRPEPAPLGAPGGPPAPATVSYATPTTPSPAGLLGRTWPILAAIILSVLGTLAFGWIFPPYAVNRLSARVQESARLEDQNAP